MFSCITLVMPNRCVQINFPKRTNKDLSFIHSFKSNWKIQLILSKMSSTCVRSLCLHWSRGKTTAIVSAFFFFFFNADCWAELLFGCWLLTLFSVTWLMLSISQINPQQDVKEKNKSMLVPTFSTKQQYHIHKFEHEHRIILKSTQYSEYQYQIVKGQIASHNVVACPQCCVPLSLINPVLLSRL